VFERHHRTGNVGLGFVQGLGIQKGAIASSVAREEYTSERKEILISPGRDILSLISEYSSM